jgi:hypothetical protein
MTQAQRIAQLKVAFNKWVATSRTRLNYKIVEARIGGWISIEFEPLNVEEMELICAFIRKYFTVTGKYTHILPKFGISQGGYPALTFGGTELDTAFPLS